MVSAAKAAFFASVIRQTFTGAGGLRQHADEGSPAFGQRGLAASADGTSTVMAWSCTAGRFKWHYAVDETIHLISGEVFVTDENDNVRRVGPGDMGFFPAGSVSTWYIPDHVRKLAVCRHSMPRIAGFALRAFNKLKRILLPKQQAASLMGSG